MEYNVSSSLTTNSPVFCRTDACANPSYYYQAVSFNVSASGSYTMTTSGGMDTYGLLYDTTFNAADPAQGVIASNDDGSSDGQFVVTEYLQPGMRYTIVVTTYLLGDTGPFVLTFYCSAPISTD